MIVTIIIAVTHSQHAMLAAVHILTHLIDLVNDDVGTVIITILQMGKLRH